MNQTPAIKSEATLGEILLDVIALVQETGRKCYAYLDEGVVRITDTYPVRQDLIILSVDKAERNTVFRDLPQGAEYEREKED